MTLNTFGERVLFLRRLWGLRQADVQRAGGPSRSTLSRIESGEDGPEDVADTTRQGLALALKCHRHWLEKGQGKVWLEGVIPPDGGDELQLQALTPEKPARPDPELGRYLSEGIMDWAILAKAVKIVETAIAEWSGGHAVELDYNMAEAYRVVYKHMSQRKDPLEPIPPAVLEALMDLAK